jgi:hypothetical protein
LTYGDQLYVCFSRATGSRFWAVFGWLITVFTGGTVNHAFTLYYDTHLGWMTLGANSNGVTYQPLGTFLKSHKIVAIFAPKKGTLWPGLNKIKEDIDKRYNYTGLLGETIVSVAHRLFHEYSVHNALSDPNRLFCSQFEADLIRANGYAFLAQYPDDAIDPSLEMSALENHEDFWSVPVPSGDWNRIHCTIS